MIDIHTHILPGIDDGSKTMENSILMAKIASESGVHSIIITPHCNIEGIFDNYFNEDIEEQFHDFERELKKEQILLEVMLGMEVYGTEEVPMLLQQGKIITLNHSRYLLLEFGFREDKALTEYLLSELINLGFLPIIAHPERYPYVQRNPNIVYHWITLGCSVQINKESFMGGFGNNARNTSQILLKNNLISTIASDAHDPYRRTTDMSEIYRFIQSNCSKEYADILLKINPKRVVEDNDLITLQPMKIEKEHGFSWINRKRS